MSSPLPSWWPPQFPGPEAAAANPVVADAVRLMNKRRRQSRTCRWLFLVNALLGVSVGTTWSDGGFDNGPVPPLAIAIVVTVGVALVTTMVVAGIGWARGDKALAKLDQDVRELAMAVVRYQRLNSFPVMFATVVTGIVALILAAFFFGIPLAINGAVYLAGGGQVSTFTPKSYDYACDSSGDCTQITRGVLGGGSSATAYTWPHAVPLGHPFQVRLAVIDWVTAGRIYSDGDARSDLTVGLLLTVLGVAFSLLFAWRMLRVFKLGRW